MDNHSLNYDNMPKHVAIIMDGNGRWAKNKLLPRQAGHKKGADVVKSISLFCNKNNIKYLTLYAFSTENWKREKNEVDYLMGLLSNYLDGFLNDKDGNNIRVDIIGDLSQLSLNLKEKINKVIDRSKSFDGLRLCLAINYGSRDEIKRAVEKIAKKIESCELSSEEIDEKLITSFLDTHEYPDPDLLIRTSNEKRLSNFLLWQIAYSEMVFIKKLWPDFTEDDLIEAIIEYQQRERRFGGRIRK